MKVRSLSRTEAKVILSLEAEGRSDLELSDLRRRARVSPGFARKLAHDLVRKGWLHRVGRGRYLLNPGGYGPEAVPETDPLRFGSRIVRPYYFGFATAAELQGLLPQVGRVYYLVTPVRRTAPSYRIAEFRTIRVDPRRFFGFRPLVRRGEHVVVSDPERTVLDCLERPEFCGGLGGVVEILESAGGRLDWDRLDRYLRRLGRRSLTLRLGYLAEAVATRACPPHRWVRRARPRAGEAYVPLAPPRSFGRRGPRDRRWHVIRNVPDAVLRAEVDIR